MGPFRSAVRLAFVAAFALTGWLVGPASSLAGPPTQSGAVEVSAAVHHDVSPPLRDIRSAGTRGPQRTRPLRLPPTTGGGGGGDPVVQTSAGPAVATTALVNFDPQYAVAQYLRS